MELRRVLAFFVILLAAQCAILRNYAIWKHYRRLPRRRWWVRPVNRVRNVKGCYHNLVQELLTKDHEEFFSLFRMWPEQFQFTCGARSSPHGEKQHQNPVADRIASGYHTIVSMVCTKK